MKMAAAWIRIGVFNAFFRGFTSNPEGRAPLSVVELPGASRLNVGNGAVR
jgi:hypothetical protein